MAEPELVAEAVCPECLRPDCPNAGARRSFADTDPRTLVGKVFVEEPRIGGHSYSFEWDLAASKIYATRHR